MIFIVDVGNLPDEMIRSFLKNNADLNIQLISYSDHERRRYCKSGISVKSFAYPGQQKNIESNSSSLKSNLDPLINSLINDHQTFLLYERSLGRTHSTTIAISHIISLVRKCVNFVNDENLSLYLSLCTPHHIYPWIFAKTCQFLDVPTYCFIDTPIPWRKLLARGINKDFSHIQPTQFACVDEDYDHFLAYVQRKRASRLEAIEADERSRWKNQAKCIIEPISDMKLHLQKILLIKKIFSDTNLNKPSLTRYLSETLNRYSCYSYYNSVSIKTSDIHADYVIFFLHWQPERTTLPEGYGYAQQARAISILSECLPPNVTLIVKEHPSSFSRGCYRSERAPFFYDNLLAIPRVRLIRAEEDSYHLMDHSLAVATINGTVALEAVCRGSKAIVFGPTCYYGFESSLLHKFTTCDALEQYILDSVPDTSSVDLTKYYEFLRYNSYTCSDPASYRLHKESDYNNLYFNIWSAALNNLSLATLAHQINV